MARNASVIDLFCGAGGFTLGAYRAGFNVALGCDIDKEALRCHEINFPNCKTKILDLQKASAKDILNEIDADHITGIVGGPPCQGFSSIGKRNSSDPRNTLFRKYFQLVSAIGPKFFVAENVPGLISPNNQSLVQEAKATVESDYTVWGPTILNASKFGCPTSRNRVFIIGIHKSMNVSLSDISKQIEIQKEKSTPTTVGEALSGIGKPTEQIDPDGHSWGHVAPPNGNSTYSNHIAANVPHRVGDRNAIREFRNKSVANGFRATLHTSEVKKRFAKVLPGEIDIVSRALRLSNTGLCPVLRAGTNTEHGSHTALRPIHPNENRVITPREAARLQGFPDWYLLHPTIWHSLRHIGNSVPPLLSEKILRAIQQLLR